MANSKKTKIKKKISALTNDNLVIRSSLGLTLISFGVLFLSPLQKEGDVSRLLLMIIYLIVLVLWAALIGEYILKTIRLQNNSKAENFSAIVAVNSLFGLFMPIFLGRLLLNKVVFDFLGKITHNGSALCEIRSEIIGHYRYLQIENLLSNLGFWILVISIVMFTWGGLFERISKK